MDLDRQVPRIPQRPVRPGDQEPDAGRGAPARPLSRLPGDAGLADHRGAGPDRRHPGGRGGRVRREGGPGQDPPGRVLRRGLRRRPAHLRGDPDRPPGRGGGGRGQGVPRRRVAGRRRDLLRPPRQLAGQPDLRPEEFRVHPAAPGRPRTWPRPRPSPRRPQSLAGSSTATPSPAVNGHESTRAVG